jgi:hypothetical protein
MENIESSRQQTVLQFLKNTYMGKRIVRRIYKRYSILNGVMNLLKACGQVEMGKSY